MERTMGNIFVLGATGHLGGKAAKHLLERGVHPSDIIAVARNLDKAEPLKDMGISVRRGDYDDPKFSYETFRGADKLLFVSSSSPDNTHRIKQHATVVEAARDAGVKHIVYTGLAYPERSTSGLENVHLATELAIRSSGIPYTIMRNAFYIDYQIISPDVERAVRSGKYLAAAGGQKVNFAARDNMAEAAAAVLTSDGHKNKTYEITYPRPYSYEDVAMAISKVSGKPIEYRDVTPEGMRDYLASLGLTPEQIARDPSAFQPAMATGWASGTSDALVDLIGRDRLITVESWIRSILGR